MIPPYDDEECTVVEYQKTVTMWPCGCRHELELRVDGKGGGILSQECETHRWDRQSEAYNQYGLRTAPKIPSKKRRRWWHR